MNKKIKSNERSKGSAQTDAHISGVAVTIAAVFFLAAILGTLLMSEAGFSEAIIGLYMGGLTLVAVYFLFAVKVASQWEKAVILHFGKFHKLAGPGLFWMIPIVDTIPNWIDHRVMVTRSAPKRP